MLIQSSSMATRAQETSNDDFCTGFESCHCRLSHQKKQRQDCGDNAGQLTWQSVCQGSVQAVAAVHYTCCARTFVVGVKPSVDFALCILWLVVCHLYKAMIANHNAVLVVSPGRSSFFFFLTMMYVCAHLSLQIKIHTSNLHIINN